MLRTLTPTSEGESHQLVLVGGEPGSGKTRLVRQFADRAAAENTAVFSGCCDPVVRSPFGPFVDALRDLTRSTELATLRASLGSTGGELTRLLPDLPNQVGTLSSPVTADADTERHRLHTAVSDLLTTLTHHHPLVLIIEDTHWADISSLLLLRHLARTTHNARLLLVATFRDTGADLPEPLVDVLADLRRTDNVVRLHLAGLTPQEVADFIQSTAAPDLSVSVWDCAVAVHRLTAGNPFLVCELWRTLVETGSVELTEDQVTITRPLRDLASPESVRDVVSQRLAHLPPDTAALLEVAATVGSDFDVSILRHATQLEEHHLLRALEEAARNGMIEAVPAPGLAFRFTHELVRRALYDRLSTVRAAEVHLRVGEALEQSAEPSGRLFADLAHHFTAAAPLGGNRGIHYNLLAARAAMASLAFDEAAARLQVALDLGPDTPERATLFLELGYARHRGGNVLSGLSAFRDAANVARYIGRSDLLAMAAIGYEEACWRPGIVDQGAIELLEEAAGALDATRDDLRVGLLAGLARALDFQGHHDRAAAARVTGMASARERGDRLGLATVLVRSYWAAPSLGPQQILRMLNQAHALADDLADTELRAEAKGWRVPTFVALGDLDSARAEISSLHHTAEQTAQPFYLHVADHYASALALSDGYLDEAEVLARRSHDWSRLLVGRDATGVHGIQMFSIRREQGRLAELAPVIRILARDRIRQGPWRPGLAALLAELGMEAEARRELSRVAEAGLDPRREPLWLASLTYLTDACTALADPATAALLYPRLEPHSGTNIMIGHLVSCYGAADRYLGMLAAVLGKEERAERHFERALEMNREMGALTWLARTMFEYGRHLLTRRPDDAQGLLAEAAELARRIGMARLLQKATALQRRGLMSEVPDGLSDREAQVLAFVARGLSNREIGSALFISEHTAANHIRNILRKTGCANRTEVTSYAHRHSLIDA